ncbi:MAG: hypothetical protein DHS20C05_20690 [Hyphococcus sp.]|nr:MAG: hypothetical protein DHS20C05_20690 [Marinicaulis sp.]
MISTFLIIIIGLSVFALFVTAALSPIETLSWWAGWTEREISGEDIEDDGGDPAAKIAAHKSDDHLYVVYLSGIASISGRFLLPRELAFIKGLKSRLPDATIIADVFPYSPAGLPLLAAPRAFDRLWRRVQKIKLTGKSTILAVLINMRNVFQVMVSADHRYGPIFNQGAADVIEQALLRHGYKRGSNAPVAIIGYSGGAQIAIGATPFLTARLGAPIDVVSIGGVMASDPGLHFLRRLHCFIGEKDNVRKIGGAMFPERWSIMAHSEWNAAKHDGRIVEHSIPEMKHAGAKGYFGLIKIGEKRNNERTQELVESVLSAG